MAYHLQFDGLRAVETARGDMMLGSTIQSRTLGWLLHAVAATAVACADAPPAVPRAESATGSDDAVLQPTEFAPYMRDHFGIAVWARDAVIAGDIEAMREPLHELSDFTYATISGPARRRLDELQRAAAAASVATTVSDAAANVATMASVCGECHRESGRGPHVSVPPGDVMGGDTTHERMSRHLAGAQQLWDGLTGPSELAFRRGARLIARAPAAPNAPAHLDAWRELEALGKRAEEAETVEARSAAYGQLLARCGACHARRDAGPLPLCMSRERSGSRSRRSERR